MLIVVLLLLECVDDTHKVFALEGCAADETAVDVGLCKELAGVAGLAAATVEGINSVLIIKAEKRSEYISIWIEGTRLGVIFELCIENETVILKIIVAYKPDRRIICRAEEIEEIQRENVFVAGAEQWLERVSFRDKYQICQEWLA